VPFAGPVAIPSSGQGKSRRSDRRDDLELRLAAGGIYRPGTGVQPCGILEVPHRSASSEPIVKIISRYVLKEHIGPFVFALSALTSLMLLQYIARRFGDLVGRGLSWQVITEFFILSVPFTVAMTLPMAVLVAVLYAFSRLASENEITAFKAGGISTRRLMRPALIVSVFVALFMLWFNDQVLSRANHELATLQLAILRTKPTFALKEQVINTVKEGQLYLRAGYIDRDQSGKMRDITIYDLNDPTRRRTIYANHGTLAFASNKRDLIMHLFDGMMLSSPNNEVAQLDRVYYVEDQLRVRDVSNSFQSINADTASKGEREMSVCEMQKEFERRNRAYQSALSDSLTAVWRLERNKGKNLPKPADPVYRPAGGIGAMYCNLINKKFAKFFVVKEVQAADVPRRSRYAQQGTAQDTVKRDTSAKKDTAAKKETAAKKDSVATRDTTTNGPPPSGLIPVPTPASPATNAPAPVTSTPPAATPPAAAAPSVATANDTSNTAATMELGDAKIRLEDARHWRNRYGVEIQKKFSLAAACIVFVLVGAPIALRFPRGGVGLVIGVSFVVFAIYYIGLIGGESLANHSIISPFWAMWADNVIFLLVGLFLVSRMGREGVTTRGGNFAETMDKISGWFTRTRSGATA
jgi:lipopolysaccharide export system permease protein